MKVQNAREYNLILYNQTKARKNKKILAIILIVIVVMMIISSAL
ncbi:MAG: hypothetical protein PUI11_05405 [Galactobacillus timonensis]|nr:hypothetical protein [Galactobacillus timonensis]